MKQRVIVGVACATFALLLFGFVIVAKPTLGQSPTSTSTTLSGFVCAQEVHFFAYDVEPNFFGPASDFESVQTQRDELHRRRCLDPAKFVADREYANGAFSSTEQRQAQVQSFLNDREAWRDAIALLELAESKCTASLETMSGSYKTLYMVKGADASQAPAIYQASPERPEFRVLRFTCPDGNGGTKQFNYKLNCGFQPVAQEFPGVPTQPVPAPPTTGGPPPTGGHTPTTTPITRPPVNSTVPPTTPPTTHGGKDPNDGINHNPGACGQGDCGPRPVAPTPPPPDSVVPTATVAPPPVTPRPTVTVVQQPTVTSTIVSPSTAPG
ncbi:hypothetical protein H0W80_01350 [Candidatus Saccharibacteria bacterium]|nr:hypothetical protein [Candidatus Saccharibacteria bacterium]